MISSLRRRLSYEELSRRFDALMVRKRYEKAWHLCQDYSLNRTLDDFSFTFSVESAKVGLMAAKAAERAGAPKRAYIESNISALIIKNEVQNPTTHKSDADKKCLNIHLVDSESTINDLFRKMTEKEKEEGEQEIKEISAWFENRRAANIRLSMLVEQKIGMRFIERWLLRRKLKGMHRYRRLER